MAFGMSPYPALPLTPPPYPAPNAMAFHPDIDPDAVVGGLRYAVSPEVAVGDLRADGEIPWP